MAVLVRNTLSRYINPISWIDLTLQSYIKVKLQIQFTQVL